jgi:hypothetical protein
MREVFSSEPNLVTFNTMVQGNYVAPSNTPVVTVNPHNVIGVPGLVSTPLAVTNLTVGKYQYIIPQQYVQGFRYVTINTSYNLPAYGNVVNELEYKIQKRYLNYDEALGLMESGFPLDYPTFAEAETNLRLIVDTYCQQEFNFWTGDRTVYGNRNGILVLPERMEQLVSATPYHGNSPFLDTGYLDSIYSDTGYLYEPYALSEGAASIDNGIRYPLSIVRDNLDDYRQVRYVINGIWGYKTTPSAVVQAMGELLKMYLADDSVYRDRYVQVIANGDTNFQFNAKTYNDSTGNAKADELLEPFKKLIIGAV